MSYDKGDLQTYKFSDTTLGATSVTHNIIGPRGKTGWVRDIMIDVTTSLVGTSTVPEINVGTSSGDTTYARYRLGTSATAGLATGVKRASQELAASTAAGYPRTLSDFSGHVALDTAVIPKDTAFVITAKAGTGGSPAGGGDYWVTIQWLGPDVP